MGEALRGKRVLVIGRGSGIARAIVLQAFHEGAEVIAAGRHVDELAASYRDLPISVDAVDLSDDASIRGLAERVGTVDHVVSTASARARGRLADLERANIRTSFDTKVIGPTILAKYIAPRIRAGGSIILFSGVHAFKPKVGYLAVGITNGAVDFLTRSLAIELAPIRVNGISPGVIDTGAWDAMGPHGKRDYFQAIEASNPAGRIGTADDVANAALFAMTNTFMTGAMLMIDGGEPLT